MKEGTEFNNRSTIADHSKATHPTPLLTQTASVGERLEPSCASWNVGQEPWPGQVDARQLLDDLTCLFDYFVVLPEGGAEALALWTVHTHAFPMRDASPYLWLQTRGRRGPSKLLALLGALVNRPAYASLIKPLELLHVVAETTPTLLIDHVDKAVQQNSNLAAMLNAGSTRSTAFTFRVANHCQGKTYAKESMVHSAGVLPLHPAKPSSCSPVLDPGFSILSCWCPKVIASGPMPLGLAAHSILVRVGKNTSKANCPSWEPLANVLRRKSARLVYDHSRAIAAARPQFTPELDASVVRLWEPLLAVAIAVGPPWPTRAREAAFALGIKHRRKPRAAAN